MKKNIFVRACKDRNMQWTVGCHLLTMLVLGITMDDFNEAVFYSQVVLLSVGFFRLFLMKRRKLNA